MLEGLGTELGLANLLVILLGAGAIAVVWARIKLLLRTDWKKVLRRQRKMWHWYRKQTMDDTGSTDVEDDYSANEDENGY